VRQLEHELAVIAQLGFAGYFLVMWDAVREARARGILCQGRGSAANSAVTYCLAAIPFSLECVGCSLDGSSVAAGEVGGGSASSYV
jgi:hypothetical protein